MEFSHTEARRATRPPALIVRLDRRPIVHIVASDYVSEEWARPFAILVERVLSAALEREVGTA